jgi:Asp/Glu/hydantoin racemase
MDVMKPRIALVHALRHSPPPIEAAFAEIWPGPQLMNILDDSLSADLARAGELTPEMTERFLQLGRYAVGTGADAILFTCSAFGPCIEAVARDLDPIPVLKPNEAMIEEAVSLGQRIGLLATFAPTLSSMPSEFPRGMKIISGFADGALAALDRGDGAEHDRIAALAARDLADCDAIALAQFSLARSAAAVAEATGRPVLTTPGSAVRKLRRLLEASHSSVGEKARA